jgi:transglutaminase-like putative cysteine protease
MPAQGALKLVNSASYDVAQRISVTNGDLSALDMLELNLPIPMDWPEQRVDRVRIHGDRVSRLHDVSSLCLIARSRYTSPSVLPKSGETRALSVTYRLLRFETHVDAQGAGRITFADCRRQAAAFAPCLRSEKLIESDAPEIVALARTLKAAHDRPFDFARAAYEYVIDHTEYASPSPSNGARECLQKGKADCGSYTALFVALCRAAGIAARPVAGCWALGENQWHCWAEFNLPGIGWIPADPSVGDRGAQERAYYFGNLDNNRVTLAKTFNLQVKTDRGSTDLGFVQVGTWWWMPAPGSTGTDMRVEHHFRGQQADGSNGR